jgi:phosphoesterase RecJ-like protein
LAIAVDCADEKRMGEYAAIFKNAKHTINIDHHENTMFAEQNYVKKGVSSTCEILYDIFKEQEIPITKSTASVLYGGIVTDTNYFRHNTSKHTHEIIADIYDRASPEQVSEILNDQTLEGLKLLHTIDVGFTCGNRVAVGTVHSEDLLKSGAAPRDILGIPDALLNVRGVKMSITFVEEPEKWRASCRAVDGYSICDIAKSQGGGFSSPRVGAFSTEKDPLTVMTELKPLIEEQCGRKKLENQINPFIEDEKERPKRIKKNTMYLPLLTKKETHSEWYIG